MRDILSIANSNAASEDLFETKLGKELTFSQLYDFEFSSNTTHASCLYEICENSSLLSKWLNNRKRIFREKFPTNPHDLVEKFNCSSDTGNCMLKKCLFCKSSEAIDDMKLDCSSDTNSSSETDISSENTYSSSEETSANVTFYQV